ncbi:MAG: O-antigen ligase family protein [Candidatus Coatesbacteria bacterium]|nr:MAG: O-antigen ligase family protein [Candidatus Coatesbacteria bacterium]
MALAPAPLFATSMAYFGLLIVAVLFVIHLLRGGWRDLRPNPLDLPLAVFLLLRILSTLTSVDPALSWKGLEKSGLLLAFYPLAHMPLRPARRWAGIYIFLAATVAAAAAGIGMFALGEVERISSPTGGYTTFAQILAVALCFLAAAAVLYSGRRRLGLAAAAVLPFGALILTFCRGQWLALVAGVGVIGALHNRRVWAVVLVIAAAAAAAAYLLPAGVASGRFTLGDPAFENYRDILWKGALEIVFDRPLTGFGPETIKVVFPYQTRFYSPVAGVIGWHNDYLRLVIESGVLAAAAAMWIVVAAVASAGRAYRRGASAGVRGLGLGLLAATAAVLVSGLVGDVISDPAMLVLFVVLWGLALPLMAEPAAARNGNRELTDSA